MSELVASLHAYLIRLMGVLALAYLALSGCLQQLLEKTMILREQVTYLLPGMSGSLLLTSQSNPGLPGKGQLQSGGSVIN